MEDDYTRNKRIAKNTIYLYIRMFITMAVGLYTSRIVLQQLGASDYGLNNVVGGVLSMFTMISAALGIGVSRFLNFAMGENDMEKLKTTFSLSLTFHIIAAVIIFVLGETIGLWVVLTQLNIPAGRETAAFWVYQFSVIGFSIGLIQTPFSACIVSHERMNIYAWMSIYSVTTNLIIVILLQYVNSDKLIFLSTMGFLVSLSSMVMYNYYCRRNFEECRFSVRWDKKLAKEILTYSGWNLVGGSYGFFADQGLNMLLNVFFGTVINAARAIGFSVNRYINQFVGNFQMAVTPQLIKLYAAHELEKLYHLVVNNCRISAYLFLILAIPAFLEIELILKVWLGDYPEYSPIFLRLTLILSIINTLNTPVSYLVHSTGRMKWPTIVGALVILTFPVSYIFLKLGFSPLCVYIIPIFFFILRNCSNIYFAHRYTKIPLTFIIKKIYLNIFIGALLMFIVPFVVHVQMEYGVVRFLVVGSTSVVWSLTVIYFWGMTPGMQLMLSEKIPILKKIGKK